MVSFVCFVFVGNWHKQLKKKKNIIYGNTSLGIRSWKPTHKGILARITVSNFLPQGAWDLPCNVTASKTETQKWPFLNCLIPLCWARVLHSQTQKCFDPEKINLLRPHFQGTMLKGATPSMVSLGQTKHLSVVPRAGGEEASPGTQRERCGFHRGWLCCHRLSHYPDFNLYLNSLRLWKVRDFSSGKIILFWGACLRHNY